MILFLLLNYYLDFLVISVHNKKKTISFFVEYSYLKDIKERKKNLIFISDLFLV